MKREFGFLLVLISFYIFTVHCDKTSDDKTCFSYSDEHESNDTESEQFTTFMDKLNAKMIFFDNKTIQYKCKEENIEYSYNCSDDLLWKTQFDIYDSFQTDIRTCQCDSAALEDYRERMKDIRIKMALVIDNDFDNKFIEIIQQNNCKDTISA